jgi:hypothetical protein
MSKHQNSPGRENTPPPSRDPHGPSQGEARPPRRDPEGEPNNPLPHPAAPGRRPERAR